MQHEGRTGIWLMLCEEETAIVTLASEEIVVTILFGAMVTVIFII